MTIFLAFLLLMILELFHYTKHHGYNAWHVALLGLLTALFVRLVRGEWR